MTAAKSRILSIRGLDPLLFRDGRPFSNEPGAFNAQTLNLPLPGTLAGFLRTYVGNHDGDGWDWDNDGPSKALQTAVSGPLLCCTETKGATPSKTRIVLPSPADAVIYGDKTTPLLMPLRPLRNVQGGTDLPDRLVPVDVTQEKALPGYNYWDFETTLNWLLDASGSATPVPERCEGLLRDERTHVKIRPETDATGETGLLRNEQTHVESEPRTDATRETGLFTVQYVSFEAYKWEEKNLRDEWSLLAKVEMPDGIGEKLTKLEGAAQFGGEQRTASVSEEPNAWPQCTPDHLNSIEGATAVRLRLQLATPAIFKHGWRPGWLNWEDKSWRGGPQESSVKLRLIAATIKRREPVSGWDYRAGHKGPKPVRWMVPAGSVFFFEVVSGDAASLAADFWLRAVSDDPQDCRDGYGLALLGVWNYAGGTK